MTHSQPETIRTLYGLLRLEARRNVGMLAFLPLAGLTLWVANSGLPELVWLWNETSYALQASVIILAPIAAGIAAWSAGRDKRRKMDDLLATMPTSRPLQSLVSCFGTLSWTAAAYLAAVALLSGLTAWYATWGAPAPEPILIGLLVTMLSGAIGFASGSWMPSRFTAPIVSVALFVGQVFVADWRNEKVQIFSPSRLGDQTDVFYELHPTLTLQYATWALGLTSVALVLIVLRSHRTPSLWLSLVLAGAVTIGGASALLAGAETAPSRITAPYEPVCDEAGFTVCVHPAYEPLLLETTRMIRSIVAPVAGLPGVPARAEQRSMNDQRYRDPDADPEELTFELVNTAYHQPGFHVLARDAAWRLVGSPDDQMEARAQSVVADWLMYQAGVALREETGSGNFLVWGWTHPVEGSDEQRVLERFIALPPDERRAWLEENWVDLRAGKLTLEDLP